MIVPRTGTVIAVLLLLTACQEAPTPAVVKLVRQQHEMLTRAGASVYAGEGFALYENAFQSAQSDYLAERMKWPLLRDIQSVNEGFESVYTLGTALLSSVAQERAMRTLKLQDSIRETSERLDGVRRLSTVMNEGRLVRRKATRAGVLLNESRVFAERAEFDLAESRVAEAASELDAALNRVQPTLDRFMDDDQISRWRRDADAVVGESERTGKYAIVVSKASRTLTLYRAGKVTKTYVVGLGMNGSSDKLFEGDQATPEGQYRVIRKVPGSKYHLALLLDYPNDEDRKRYANARKRGEIPLGVRIGGLVEIHGGGKDSVTDGCVAMENPDMDAVFKVAEKGTPVAIVGALRVDNRISTALKGMRP